MNIESLNNGLYKNIIFNIYLIDEYLKALNKDIEKCKSKNTLKNLLNDKKDCLIKQNVLLNLKSCLEKDF